MKHAHDESPTDSKRVADSKEIDPGRLRKKRTGPAGHRSRIGLSLLAIALLLLWLTPWIIVKTPLRNSIAQQALGDFEGTIDIGSASTGWLSPITLEQVQLRDANGELLAEVEQVVSHRALLSLLTHLSSPGQFTISRPAVYVIAHADALNWERAIEPWLNAPEPQRARPVVSVVVEEGELFTRRGEEENWQSLRIPSATIELDAQSLALHLQLANQFANDRNSNDSSSPKDFASEDAPGTIELQLSQSTLEETSSPSWRGELTANQFDLAWASPLLERVEPTSSLSGTLDGAATLDGELETGQLSTHLRQLSISNLDLQVPSLTRAQALQMTRVLIDGSLIHRDAQITTERLSLDSALAQLTANGTLDLGLFRSRDFAFTDLPDLHVEGTIDLERLGESLPGLVRLREGLTIEQGTATLVAISREEGSERRLFIDLNATDLHAIHEGRSLTWKQPLHVSFSARGRDETVWLEFFECDAEFLQFSGSGDPRQGKMEGQADLARLRNQLEQFVEMGNLRLAGALAGSVTWAPAPTNELDPAIAKQAGLDGQSLLRIQSSMSVQQWQLGWTDSAAWIEEQVTLDATCDVERRKSAAWRIWQGAAKLQTATEVAQVWLRQPFEPTTTSSVELDVEVTGDMENLMTRLRPLLDDQAIDAQGQLNVSGPILISDRLIKFDHVAAGIKNLNFVTTSLRLQEPEIKCDLVGQIDLANSTLDLSTSTLAGSTLAMSLTRFRQSWKESTSKTDVDLAYRADAFRLMSMINAMQSTRYRPFGEVTGNATITNNQELLHLNVTGESIPFTLGKKRNSPDGLPAQGAAYESVWAEEEISFAAKIKHRWKQERFVFEQLDFSSPSLAVNGQGFIARPNQDAFIEINGEIMTDLDRISERTSFLTKQTVEVRGKSKEPFEIRGRLRDLAQDGQAPIAPTGLVPRSLSASIATQIESANIVGLETGGARVAAKLQGQVIRMEPIDLQVGQGKFSASPLLRLSGDIPVLELRDEHLLQHVALTPEVTRSWIGYTAPILASSTKAAGTFSVDIDRAAIPLTQVFAGEASGRLVIDEASLGPGPLGVQLLSLARQIRLTITGRAGTQSIEDFAARLPQQTIQFRLHDQRMYHDQVLVQFDDLELLTSGSIGADQSLDMVVEVRIPPSWVAGRPIAAALANANLKVPLRGKLSAPDLDARQLLRQLGGSLLENELRRGLRDIFGGGNE